jgi:alpha-tubulin suppressor-like RCC1 family protein
VVNPDGRTGIRVNGLTYSSEPTWVTASPLANQAANTAFGVNLSATGASSYSVAAGSTLPAGTTLAANGYFSGTVTIGTETTYSFVITATDAELQDANKTFQVTVTVTPPTRLYVWGRNTFHHLGLIDTNDRSSPTQVGSGTGWSDFDSSIYASFGVKTDGTLWAWGANALGFNGILGLNSSTGYQSSPVQVGTNTNWSNVSAGYGCALAIKTDGTLWTWGSNTHGSLGFNDRVSRSSPTQVGAGTNWLKASVALYSVLAIKTDNTLWGWGQNNFGNLGTNDLLSRSSPVQIGSDTNWSDAKGGSRHTIALKTDGTIWSFGGDSFSGSLGLNLANAYRSSPVQIGSPGWPSNTWSAISTRQSTFSNLGIKTDGTLWGWGGNGVGQLGLDNTVYKSSPIQIGSGTDWSKVSHAGEVSVGIKTNGTLWLWGRGNYGALGLNDTNHRSSPTQIGTNTNWSDVYAGQQHIAAITTN